MAELGSDRIIEHFTRSEDRSLHVSALAPLEVRSALRRREFDGDMSASDLRLALTTLMQETGRIVEHPLTAQVFSAAAGAVDRHRLRALDGLQLGSAIICRTLLSIGDTLIFVASDVRLLTAAEAEGFAVWDPTTRQS